MSNPIQPNGALPLSHPKHASRCGGKPLIVQSIDRGDGIAFHFCKGVRVGHITHRVQHQERPWNESIVLSLCHQADYYRGHQASGVGKLDAQRTVSFVAHCICLPLPSKTRHHTCSVHQSSAPVLLTLLTICSLLLYLDCLDKLVVTLR